MAILKVDVEKREGAGTRASRKLRANGLIPGNVYAHGEPPVAVTMDSHKFARLFNDSLHLVTLTFPEGDTQIAAVREMQRDPMTQEILHIDFIKVRMDEATEFQVALVFEGVSEGVKDGGVLTISSEFIHIECLPGNIPEHIGVDISPLKIGDSITAVDIVLPPEVKLVSDPAMVIVSVTSIRIVEEDLEPAAVEGEPVEGEDAEAADGDKPEGEVAHSDHK